MIEDQVESIDLPTRNAEALLAYLLLNPEIHTREKVAGLFWGGVSDKKARDSLRNELATLRRILGKDLLKTDRQTVALNPNYPLWVDVWALEAIVSTDQQQRQEHSPTPVHELYRGELLPGFYDDWILAKREQLKQALIAYLLDRAQAARAQGDYHKAIENAEAVLQLDPIHERAHQHLIFSHLALGDRTAALHQFERCKRVLMQELAVEPAPDTRALKEWIERPPSWFESPAARISNLPIPLGSLVGRQDELTMIKRTLSSHRLVTLTGPGGIGKTRLAVRAATDLIDRYRDGSWWVDLTAISNPKHITQAVTKAFGIQESRTHRLKESLWQALRPKHTLLLLDNCEHLLETCARLVSDLLGHCPNLHILVTSRQPLHLPGERMINILPLSLPDSSNDMPVSSVAAADSAKLFVERAQAARSNFELTSANAHHVAQICLQLDGIPLALELAASQTHTMSLHQIETRLQNHLDPFEVGPRSRMQRHRTLHAAIDWSYELLTNSERALFRRLAVFSDGFDAAAAQVICDLQVENTGGMDTENIAGELASLVDKSLLNITFVREEPRYRMLEIIRRFALHQLERSDQEEIFRQAHHEHFASLVKSAKPHLGFFLSDLAMERWIDIFEREEGNLRTALAFGRDNPDFLESALAMAVDLHWFWFVRGRFSEGRSWLQQLIDSPAIANQENRAKGWATLGFLACWRGDFEAGIPSFEQARTIFQDIGDKSWLALTLHGLGFAASGVGDEARAAKLFNESLQIARRHEDRWMIAFSLHFLGIGHSFQENYSQAREYFEESIVEMAALGGNQPGVGYSYFHLGRIALLQGELARASNHLMEAIRNFRKIGDQRGLAYAYGEMVGIFLARDRPRQAASLAGALIELQAKLGPLLEETLEKELKERLEMVRVHLGEDAYLEALERGQYAALDESTTSQLLLDEG